MVSSSVHGEPRDRRHTDRITARVLPAWRTSMPRRRLFEWWKRGLKVDTGKHWGVSGRLKQCCGKEATGRKGRGDMGVACSRSSMLDGTVRGRCTCEGGGIDKEGMQASSRPQPHRGAQPPRYNRQGRCCRAAGVR